MCVIVELVSTAPGPPSIPRTDMKRVGLRVIGIGVLINVGPLAVERGYAGENGGATKCTLATLKGRYLFAGTGTLLPPAFGVKEPSVSTSAVRGSASVGCGVSLRREYSNLAHR